MDAAQTHSGGEININKTQFSPKIWFWLEWCERIEWSLLWEQDERGVLSSQWSWEKNNRNKNVRSDYPLSPLCMASIVEHTRHGPTGFHTPIKHSGFPLLFSSSTHLFISAPTQPLFLPLRRSTSPSTSQPLFVILILSPKSHIRTFFPLISLI